MPQCPGCGRSYGQPPLNTRCDTCGAAFCYNGNCEGTLHQVNGWGSGRSAGSTCPTCRKGKPKKL